VVARKKRCSLQSAISPPDFVKNKNKKFFDILQYVYYHISKHQNIKINSTGKKIVKKKSNKCILPLKKEIFLIIYTFFYLKQIFFI